MKRTTGKIRKESGRVSNCAGGKGTYSSYGRYVPANKRKTVRAHHDESEKMLDALRNDGPNYDIGLNIRRF